MGCWSCIGGSAIKGATQSFLVAEQILNIVVIKVSIISSRVYTTECGIGKLCTERRPDINRTRETYSRGKL